MDLPFEHSVINNPPAILPKLREAPEFFGVTKVPGGFIGRTVVCSALSVWYLFIILPFVVLVTLWIAYFDRRTQRKGR